MIDPEIRVLALLWFCGKKALKAAYMNVLSVPLFAKLTLLRETGQDETREDKSRQDRAKQDRTRQDSKGQDQKR